MATARGTGGCALRAGAVPPGPPCLGLKRELVQGQCQGEEKPAQHFPQPDVVSPGHKIKRLRRNMKRCIDFSFWFFFSFSPLPAPAGPPQPGAGGASLGAPVGCITAGGYGGDAGEFLVLCPHPGSDPKPARGAAALHSLRVPALGRLPGATHVPKCPRALRTPQVLEEGDSPHPSPGVHRETLRFLPPLQPAPCQMIQEQNYPGCSV